MNRTPATSTTPAGAAVALTTATPANIGNGVTLDVGTYLVWAVLNASLTAASLTSLIASLSLTSGVLGAQPGQFVDPGRIFPEGLAQSLPYLTTATGVESLIVGPTVLTVRKVNPNAAGVLVPAQQVTLYLVAQASFSAGNVSAYGSTFAMPLPTD